MGLSNLNIKGTTKVILVLVCCYPSNETSQGELLHSFIHRLRFYGKKFIYFFNLLVWPVLGVTGLKGPCHKNFALSGQFFAEVITSFTYTATK